MSCRPFRSPLQAYVRPTSTRLGLEWVRLVTIGISVRNLHAVRSTQRGKYSTVSFVLAGFLPSGIVRHIGIIVGDGGEIWPRITHKKCGLQKPFYISSLRVTPAMIRPCHIFDLS